MSQQQQMFAGQQAYSRQLSQQMAAPYGGGLGAQGFGGGFGAGGGFSYGGGFAGGYGPGNSFGNSAMSAMGGVGHAAMGGLGWAGMAAGFGAGGLGGALMGGALGFGAGALGGFAINQMVQGGQEQGMIERTLSQFNFSNAGSRSGRGFSRNDSQGIGNMVRQMERIPEMLTSFGELNRIMDKMGQMGLMQGVRDASEFQRKFKDTISTLKEMSKVLGGTMEDALAAMGEARRSGFYSSTDITKNAMARRVTGSMTGMNQGQVGALQMYGADLGHAMGGSRRSGAMLATRTAAQLGMANQMGILSNDQIAEMTGKEGAEGIQDLAGSMTQLTYRMARSNVGQAMTLALGKQVDGRYTGDMDQELVAKVRRGEMSLEELKSMARRKASTRGAKLSFAAHQERLRAEMAGAVGSEGIGMQLQEILGNRGWNNPDATNLVMQRFGASEEQANLLQKMMPNMDGISSQMGGATNAEARQAAKQAAMRETFSLDAVKKRIKTRIAHYTTDLLKDAGNELRSAAQDAADSFMDEVTGNYTTTLTKGMASSFTTSAAGGGGGLGGRLRGMGGLSMGDIRAGAGDSFSFGRLGMAAGAGAAMGSMFGGVGAVPGAVIGAGVDAAVQGRNWIGKQAGRFMRMIDGRETAEQRSSKLLGMYNLQGTGKNDAINRMSQLDSDSGAAAEWEKLSKSSAGGGRAPLRDAYQAAMADASVIAEKDDDKRLEKTWEVMKRHLQASGSGWVLGELAKNGMSGGEVVAAVRGAEAKAGRRGSLAEASARLAGRSTIMGDVNLDDNKAISKFIEKTDKHLTETMKASDTSFGWADVRGHLDAGDDYSRIILGNGGAAGLASGGDPAKVEGAKRLRSVIAKGAGMSAEDKAWLSKTYGVNGEEFAKGLDRETVAKLLGTNLSSKEILQSVYAKDRSGANVIKDALRAAGGATMDRLVSAGNSDRVSALRGSKEGAEVLNMLWSGAMGQAGMSAEGLAGYRDHSGDIAMKLLGGKMSKAQQDAALALGGESLGAAMDVGRRGKRAGKGGFGKGGMDVHGLVRQLFGENASLSDEDYKRLEGMVSGGKNKNIDSEKELNAVLADLGNMAGTGKIIGASGKDSKSEFVSEKEVSDALLKMSENNKTVAQMLGNLSAGKPANEGLTSGTSK
jgi:hypothetical protein